MFSHGSNSGSLSEVLQKHPSSGAEPRVGQNKPPDGSLQGRDTGATPAPRSRPLGQQVLAEVRGGPRPAVPSPRPRLCVGGHCSSEQGKTNRPNTRGAGLHLGRNKGGERGTLFCNRPPPSPPQPRRTKVGTLRRRSADVGLAKRASVRLFLTSGSQALVAQK